MDGNGKWIVTGNGQYQEMDSSKEWEDMQKWAVTNIWDATMKSHIELDVHIKHRVRYIAVRPKHVVFTFT